MKEIKVVAAIIQKENKILATKRGYGEFINMWEFPGGKIESGETKEQALVREIKEEDTYKYGIISITDLFSEEKVVKVNDMIEKPNCNPPSNIASVGRYILDNNMFKYLHELSKEIIYPKELGITEAIKIACKMDNVYAYSFHGKRFDIGDHAGYVEANIAFSLKDEKINHEILDYIKEVTTNEDD